MSLLLQPLGNKTTTKKSKSKYTFAKANRKRIGYQYPCTNTNPSNFFTGNKKTILFLSKDGAINYGSLLSTIMISIE